jgi:hypothetical protein
MEQSFYHIVKTFYELGYDLLTPEDVFEKYGKDSSSFVFCYAGPCGHVRYSRFDDIYRICPICFGGTSCRNTEGLNIKIRYRQHVKGYKIT